MRVDLNSYCKDMNWIKRGGASRRVLWVSYLLKALCCQSTPSWLKVLGWWKWWPMRLYCHLLGLVPFPFPFPRPRPSPSPIRLTVLKQINKTFRTKIQSGFPGPFPLKPQAQPLSSVSTLKEMCESEIKYFRWSIFTRDELRYLRWVNYILNNCFFVWRRVSKDTYIHLTRKKMVYD